MLSSLVQIIYRKKFQYLSGNNQLIGLYLILIYNLTFDIRT